MVISGRCLNFVCEAVNHDHDDAALRTMCSDLNKEVNAELERLSKEKRERVRELSKDGTKCSLNVGCS